MCCLLRLGSCKSNMKESDLTSREQNLGSLWPESVQANTEIHWLTFSNRWLKQSVSIFYSMFVCMFSNWFPKNQPSCGTQLQLIITAPNAFFVCQTPGFALKYIKIRLNSWTALKRCQQIDQIKLKASRKKQDKSICFNAIWLPLTEGERGDQSETAEEGEDKCGSLKCLRKKNTYRALSYGAYRCSGRILLCNSFIIVLCCPSLTIWHSLNCDTLCSHNNKTLKLKLYNFQMDSM